MDSLDLKNPCSKLKKPYPYIKGRSCAPAKKTTGVVGDQGEESPNSKPFKG